MQSRKLTPEEQKLATLEKHRAHEISHAMIVKIISWKAGLQEGAAINQNNKITPEEWEKYRQHVFATYKPEGKAKAEEKIKEAEEKIRANGGFAE